MKRIRHLVQLLRHSHQLRLSSAGSVGNQQAAFSHGAHESPGPLVGVSIAGRGQAQGGGTAEGEKKMRVPDPKLEGLRSFHLP